jgi:hypothetical protein
MSGIRSRRHHAVIIKAWTIADGGVPRKPQAWLRSAPGVSVVPEVPNDVDSWSPLASGRTDQALGRPRPLNKAILYGKNSSR